MYRQEVAVNLSRLANNEIPWIQPCHTFPPVALVSDLVEPSSLFQNTPEKIARISFAYYIFFPAMFAEIWGLEFSEISVSECCKIGRICSQILAYLWSNISGTTQNFFLGLIFPESWDFSDHLYFLLCILIPHTFRVINFWNLVTPCVGRKFTVPK